MHTNPEIEVKPSLKGITILQLKKSQKGTIYIYTLYIPVPVLCVVLMCSSCNNIICAFTYKISLIPYNQIAKEQDSAKDPNWNSFIRRGQLN